MRWPLLRKSHREKCPGRRTVASISAGQFLPTGSNTRTPGGRAGRRGCLFRDRIASIWWSIGSGADDRSGFVEGSGAPFLLPAVSRERDRTRAPLLAGGRTASPCDPCYRTVATDERAR